MNNRPYPCRQPRWLWCSLLLVLVTFACGEEGRYEQVKDVVQEVGDALCDHAITCGDIKARDRDKCKVSWGVDACEQVNCNASYDGSSERVDACIDAIDAWSCASDTLTLPCHGVLDP